MKMKKTLIVVVILILAVSIPFYLKSKKTVVSDKIVASYSNTRMGIAFTYPKILSASSTPDSVNIHHQVPFTHHDFCDFKGESDTTIDTMTDFDVTFRVVNKNILETMKSESPYIPQENFVNNEVIPSPGFIDRFKVGNLEGFQIFEGAEGCGHTIYYLKVSDQKTLVIINKLITVFTGSIDVANKSRAEAVPGVINKEKSEEIFMSILKSMKAN